VNGGEKGGAYRGQILSNGRGWISSVWRRRRKRGKIEPIEEKKEGSNDPT
jgi:hypothetical protein